MIRVAPKTALDWAHDAARTADKLAQELERGAVTARTDHDERAERLFRVAVMQARLIRRQLLDEVTA